MPSRKTIRSWLLPVSAHSTATALRLVLVDVGLFALNLVAIVAVHSLALKLLLGVLCGGVIARLFILGHDACHQSFTSHRRLNRWLGRLVFLPSLTPYSLWEAGHNVVHHGYTNLKGFDLVWEPKTPEEFRALPRWRQALERVYRSGWAPGLYYLVEMWWLRMYFPSPQYMPSRRRIFMLDGVLVTCAALAWIGGLILAARLTAQSAVTLAGSGFVLPFLVWNTVIGFVVYVHHTHPRIAWHQDKAAWTAAQPYLTTTVHLKFRPLAGIDLGALLHHICEHTAHHVDMGVPLYRLRRAQQILEDRLPGCIVVQIFTWRWYFDTARHCKLYDLHSGRWTDFAGRPTCGTTCLPTRPALSHPAPAREPAP